MESPDKILLVGAGSIAYKHAAFSKKAFAECEIVQVSASGRSLRPQADVDCVAASVAEALDNHDVDMAIVASPAVSHLAFTQAIISQVNVPVLVEKPLASNAQEAHCFLRTGLPENHFIRIAYCLRHHPGFAKLLAILSSGDYGVVRSVQAEVGQHLQDWRGDKNYQTSVSAQKRLGGGALLELSHELDYLRFMLGNLELQHGQVSHTGTLNIDVEDVVNLSLVSGNIPVNLHLDLLQRPATRMCKIITDKNTIVFDWLDASIRIDDQEVWSTDQDSRLSIYEHQLTRFWMAASTNNPDDRLASLDDAVAVLDLIDQAKLEEPEKDQ